jgi:hypothetical protein
MPEALKMRLPLSFACLLLSLPLALPMMAQTAKPTPPPTARPVPTHTAAVHTGKTPEALPPAHEMLPGERPSEAHAEPVAEHTTEPERNPEHAAEPEYITEPENHAEPKIERTPWHPEPENTPQVADRPRERTGSAASTSRDGITVTTEHDAHGEWLSTTTNTIRDGYTTTRTNNRNGSISVKSDDPRESRSTHTDSGSSSGTYSGVEAGRIPNALRPAELNSEASEATLHQMNTVRARLGGINGLPIPEGRILSTSHGTIVNTVDGRQYSLRADGTLRSFRSGLPMEGQTRAYVGPSPDSVRALPRSPMALTGNFATFRRDGRILSLRTGGPDGINIQHVAHGGRVIIAHRPDQSTLVSTGRHSGYLERTIDQDGRALVVRTYVSGNRTWQRTYVGSSKMPRNAAVAPTVGGVGSNRVVFRHYLPRSIYEPAFYGWANGGWAAPVSYQWGWGNRRWYVFYSLFFAPWPVYPDGSSWLTDYALGQTLEDGYDTQQPDDGSAAADGSASTNVDSAPADPGQQSDDDTVYAVATTAITPEIKQEIAAEVHQQLAQDSAAGADADPVQAAAPDDPEQFMEIGHTFVVSTPVTASVRREGSQPTSALVGEFTGQGCNLSPGDVLRLTSIPGLPQTSTGNVSGFSGIAFSGELEVTASQRGDCPMGVQVMLSTVTLQGMENDFQAHLDDGLHLLYSQQGKDGLPVAPPTTATGQPDPAGPAASSADLSAQIQGLQTQANRAEAQITQTVLSTQAATNQP